MQGMTIQSRSSFWLAAVLALSACTTDDGTTGLLDLDGSTQPVSVEDATLKIVGPGSVGSGGVTVTALCSRTGFFAELLDGNDKPIPNTFIRITTDLGTVRASSGNSGSGAVTDANGRARFTYTAPGSVSANRNEFDELVAITGLQNPDTRENVTIESDPYEIEVTNGPPPDLTLIGPGNLASGTFEMPASLPVIGTRTRQTSSLARGLVADVRPGVGCQPNENHQINLTTEPSGQGAINAPPDEPSSNGGLTDRSGELEFDYVAPANITAPTDITISASTTIARQTDRANYILTVLPPNLRLTGPPEAFPGQTRTGYRVQLTRSDGQAIPEARIDLQASGSGAIEHIRSNPNQQNLETDAFGIINFSFTPRENISSTTNVTITANAVDLGISRTLVVAVRPDSFDFTTPTANAAINTEFANRQNIEFRWTDASGQGIEGDVTLSTGNSEARFVINNDVESRGLRQVTVRTDSSGNFSVPVQIFSNFSEFVTITATAANQTQLKDSLTIQFVDQTGSNPDSVILVASPTALDASTNPGATADVTFSVTNSSNEPIDGINVVFEIVGGSTHNNEEIFPIGGTTRQGEATTTYYSRPGTGTAVPVILRACIEGGGLCDDYEITVE